MKCKATIDECCYVGFNPEVRKGECPLNADERSDCCPRQKGSCCFHGVLYDKKE